MLTVLARVGSFTSSNRNHLNSTIRESCVDKCRPETSEATSGSSANILLHGTFFPVAKSSPVMIRATTEHNDQTSNKQSEDRYDLYGCKYELGFSVNRNGENVQKDDDDDDDRDPYSRAVPSWESVVFYWEPVGYTHFSS
jgi:hypothetical protein